MSSTGDAAGPRVAETCEMPSGSSIGGEDGTCILGRFAPGGELRVGEGELDRNGRLRHGELEISRGPEDGMFG